MSVLVFDLLFSALYRWLSCYELYGVNLASMVFPLALVGFPGVRMLQSIEQNSNTQCASQYSIVLSIEVLSIENMYWTQA